MGKIQFIHCHVKSLQRSITIKPRGRSILIVGQNGAGKTSFLTAMFDALTSYVAHGHARRPDYLHQVGTFLDYMKQQPGNEANYARQISIFRERYIEYRKDGFFKISGVMEFSRLYAENGIVLKFFKAQRQAEIRKVTSAGAILKTRPQANSNQSLCADLEQHLVNLRVRSALAYIAGTEDAKAKSLEEWFENFESDLKYLFEDDSVRLIFDSDHMRYLIAQNGRLNYSFQELSSGYSAIFDIFGDLVVRSEYLRISPKDLSGIVFIDEIDAHLHVSLQRKILPFLMSSFPEIQFIVTTHSPFVLSSVDDVFIFDLSTGKTAIDLSMYSVDAILEGLLGVPPISKKLENLIKDLSKYTSGAELDIAKAKELIDVISPYLDSLDEESRMYFEISKNKALRAGQGGRSV